MKRAFNYDGHYFKSIRDFTTKYDLPYQQTLKYLKAGYTLEQILNGEVDTQSNTWMIEVSYRGRTYPSLKAFCNEHNLQYSRIYSLLRQGLGIEEILQKEGLAISSCQNENFITDENGDYSISKMTKGIKNVFENNPYCVLGIPCNSTNIEALEIRDKLEKLNRLGATDAYRSGFDLKFIKRPDRSLEHIQVILHNLNKMEHRWMWFLTSDFAISWQMKEYFSRCNPESFDYDTFLACYYNVLITDSAFTDKYRWITIFRILNWFSELSDVELFHYLTDRISDEEKRKYNYRMIVNSFRENIKKPLIECINDANGQSLLSIVLLIEKRHGRIENELKNHSNSIVLQWADRSLSELNNLVDAIGAKKSSANSEEVRAVYTHLNKLGKNDFKTAENIALKMDSMYSEMLMRRFVKPVYNGTNILIENGHKKEACRFDSMIYIYCNDFEKDQIKKIYPIEWLHIPDSEFTVEECRSVALKFEEACDWTNRFKWMMKAASKGDAESQNDIGVYYEYGNGVAKNDKEAVKWYKKASQGGSIVALDNLASLYFSSPDFLIWDSEKAKACWIKAFILDIEGGYDEKLDRYFPGWRHMPHSLLEFSEQESPEIIQDLAEREITSAQYCLGVFLYKGINGFGLDRDRARRWMLKAAVYDHPKAVSDLKTYYGIDINVVITARSMFDLGYTYSGKTGSQNEDLRFYWYYKSVINGFKSGYNNLGVCYDLGTGVEKDYKKANEYYLLAIEYENNTGALGNYGVNLYLGHGVDKDEALAKKYLLKAKEAGNSYADTFLKEHFGISDSQLIEDIENHEDSDYAFANDEFEDVEIYDKNGLRIEFGGFTVNDEGVFILIWTKNTSNEKFNIWLNNIVIDDELEQKYIKVTKSLPKASWVLNNVHLEKVDTDTYYDIEFTVEIDDIRNNVLDFAKRVNVYIDFSEKEIDVSLREHMEFINRAEDEEDEPDNSEETVGEEEIDDEYDIEDDDLLYIPGSLCKKNKSQNGLELYFTVLPSEYIRDKLIDHGWQWYEQKHCWCVSENSERIRLAKKITGREVKG